MNIKKQKLLLTEKDINIFQIDARYQTMIDQKRKNEIIKDWNIIVEMNDDWQDIYMYLHRYAYNKFLGGHTLIDGNKRMNRFLTSRINDIIEYKDIL